MKFTKKIMSTVLAAVMTAAVMPAAVQAEETVSPEPAEKGAVTMYRVYNLNSGEHFFTANKAKRDHLISLGWHDESIGWYGLAE